VHLRRDEVTLPALLKQAGYATCLSGKWHCNAHFNSPEQPQPDAAGFDHWFATQNNAAPSHENPVNFVRNVEPTGPLEGYSCQLVVDEVIGWLDRRAEAAVRTPFFAYVAFHEPHTPVASPPELVARYRPKAKNDDQAQYFANFANLDAAVGRLLAALERLNLAENTLVFFSSDLPPFNEATPGARILSGRNQGASALAAPDLTTVLCIPQKACVTTEKVISP
jgi:arylsulfatase A